MRYSLFALSLFIWTSQALAFDVSTQSVVIAGYVTSQVTTAPFDNKLVLSAQDDAATFVASDGRLQGARLAAALSHVRHAHPHLRASDLELAQAILVR